jgi:hypothetical protein
MKRLLFGIALVFGLAICTPPKARADYWCPGSSQPDVGIYAHNGAWLPYRYCYVYTNGEELDFYIQFITWGDYWDLKRELGL